MKLPVTLNDLFWKPHRNYEFLEGTVKRLSDKSVPQMQSVLNLSEIRAERG